MTAFSSRDEALAAWSALRAVVERLPADSRQPMDHLAGALYHMRNAINAAPLCDPADAVGTHAYRTVHALEEISTNE